MGLFRLLQLRQWADNENEAGCEAEAEGIKAAAGIKAEAGMVSHVFLKGFCMFWFKLVWFSRVSKVSSWLLRGL